MITEDYVSFESAKLLKEKGFNEKCKRMFRVSKNSSPKFYDSSEWITNEDLCDLYQNCEFATIPTLQMAMKWLREIHGFDIDISIEYTNKKVYYYFILKTVIRDIDCLHSETNFESYEQACEDAIKYCLENLV